MSLQTDNFLGNFGFNFDFDACINVRSSKGGNDIDEPVLAHRLVLSSASTRFRNLLAAGQPEDSMAKIDIDLREIPNSINAFKAMLSGLYTGELNFSLADHAEVGCSGVIPCPTTTSLLAPPTPPVDDNRAHTDDSSSPNNTPTIYSEKIVPNDDKEGWCRNKKYIEKVDNGFMCTVCRKIYGRYNSVSYHVTIYHRNPPIRCDESGCQFSTREARYIHFHKYYRHHIPLPDSIDLGSRKCPFCRHVSKSPAMLEKHIARHVPERKEKSTESYNCDQCMYRGNTEALLGRHKQFAHSMDVFSEGILCSLCQFSSTSKHSLILHIASAHPPSESKPIVEAPAPKALPEQIPVVEI
ncbi:BTB domain-containing protein [Trichostrongylus colubriformis]|uniref:BTB domain-containing protein n=1 Tax=Trichostrongylus colubriformis TaxID=6319 RepID=A0AAN8FYX7_TRICO